MGKKVISKDKKDNKLQIPIADLEKEGIEDQNKLRVEIKSNNNKLYLNSYLNVTSGGQINITKYGVVEIDKHYELYPNDKVICFYNKEDFEKNFIDYYKLFKSLAEKHKKLGFGQSPRLSEGFTENLCRYLYGLYKIKGRIYDAIDGKGCSVEIKATTSIKGTVSINSDVEFDYLLWMYFDLDHDKLSIYKIKYSSFKEKFEFNSDRITINLNLFAESNPERIYFLTNYKFKSC